MSVQNLPPNPETEAEPEELTIRRLVRAIDYAEGFWLGFAKSNTPAQRRRLAALCKDLLEPLKIRVLEIELNEPVTDLLPVLRERLSQEGAATPEHKLAIFVHGLERSIPSREAYPPLLSALNLNRELFRQQVPHPLLLWLPDYALTALARKAPDFWAWRSGLYEFAPERKTIEQSLVAVRGEGLQVTQNLSERAKRNRLVMLKGLADDYRELGEGSREQEARANILNEIGLMHEGLGEWIDAKRAYEESINISRNLHHEIDEAIALHNLAGIMQDLGDIKEAHRLYSESLEIKKRLDDQKGVAITLHELGTLAHIEGNTIEARRLYHESLEIMKQFDYQRGIGMVLNNLAVVAQRLGDFEEAYRLYDQSINIKKKLGDQRGISITLHQLGNLAHTQGELEEARRLYHESLEIKKNLGDQSGVANTLNNLARLAEGRGDMAEAARLLHEALNIFEKLGSPYAEEARQSLARLESREDDVN
ncbi:MAG: tetratricopeptide repeat protein [Acidobacteria bacterium]|nr:tetratricopeptide repeat protein [Acidobacteriota bacterium]